MLPTGLLFLALSWPPGLVVIASSFCQLADVGVLDVVLGKNGLRCPEAILDWFVHQAALLLEAAKGGHAVDNPSLSPSNRGPKGGPSGCHRP